MPTLLHDGEDLTYHPDNPSLPPNSPAPKPEAVGADRAPVRDPPAWRMNYKIGTGACGTVFLENVQIPGMESPELWAVKRIPRDLPNFTFKRYQAEIKNLQALASVSFAWLTSFHTRHWLHSVYIRPCLTWGQHEWFVKFNSTYEDAHYLYIAMEYIPMGDMSQSFVDGYRWSESDTKVVIKQLLRGLAVMHKEGITHRDLKPEVCVPPLLKHRYQNLIVSRTYSSISQRVRLTPSVLKSVTLVHQSASHPLAPPHI